MDEVRSNFACKLDRPVCLVAILVVQTPQGIQAITSSRNKVRYTTKLLTRKKFKRKEKL